MVEAAVKLADGAGGRIVPIHKIRVHPNPDKVFTPISDVGSCRHWLPLWVVAVPDNTTTTRP